jgi:hypothetical protein
MAVRGGVHLPQWERGRSGSPPDRANAAPRHAANAGMPTLDALALRVRRTSEKHVHRRWIVPAGYGHGVCHHDRWRLSLTLLYVGH